MWVFLQGRVRYLEGQEVLVSRYITPIPHITTLNIPIINLLNKSPLTLQVGHFA